MDVQLASVAADLPTAADIESWVLALLEQRPAAELSVRLVDAEEGLALNRDYRGRTQPTNVLSFPAELPHDVAAELDLLGDVVICAPVVSREAREQGKRVRDHYAHMVVHGTLHLLGHDHQDDQQAQRMEDLERRALARFGIPDPYATHHE